MRQSIRHPQFGVVDGGRDLRPHPPARAPKAWSKPARVRKAGSKTARAPLPIGFAALVTALLVFTFPDWSRWIGWDGIAFSASSGPAVVGMARVIDADTIELQGLRVRLEGIDAPERAQSCELADGMPYPCGQQARMALADRIGSRDVECRGDERDRYGRTLAVCYLGSEDLNGWLVSEGWAIAYTRYSLTYVPQETMARLAGRGIWAGNFEMPEDWRRSH